MLYPQLCGDDASYVSGTGGYAVSSMCSACSNESDAGVVQVHLLAATTTCLSCIGPSGAVFEVAFKLWLLEVDMYYK